MPNQYFVVGFCLTQTHGLLVASSLPVSVSSPACMSSPAGTGTAAATPPPPHLPVPSPLPAPPPLPEPLQASPPAPPSDSLWNEKFDLGNRLMLKLQVAPIDLKKSSDIDVCTYHRPIHQVIA